MAHIYIYDKENNLPVAEAKDEAALFQIKQVTSPCKFEQEYFVMNVQEKVNVDDYIGFYPADWQPYIVE